MQTRVTRRYIVLDEENRAYLMMERRHASKELGTAKPIFCSVCGEAVKLVYIRICFQSTPNSEAEYVAHPHCIKKLLSDLNLLSTTPG